ncbi:putative receptor protein kinase ZmPK1 [Bienertia sinuspersici]
MMFSLLKADFDLKFVSIDTTDQFEKVELYLCNLLPILLRNLSYVQLVQTDIVELIRGKFIIPDGKIYNDAMLKHFELKARYFNPIVRTRQQIENDNPGGIKYGDNGREARAMLSHLHTNGSTSFSNSRDEFEMEHGTNPGGYEFFDRTHKTKDGDMAKSKVDASVASSSSLKPRIEVEDEVFNELMYDKDNSNQNPVGYGFRVKRSDVMGVHALLRKKKALLPK